ncbi:MAG: hypothetical protein QW548_02320 [Candidatus Aenigmatarchaeota archaeon]
MKGIVHVIEAVIAIAMITVAAILLFKPLQPADYSAQLVSAGYAALRHLENVGNLRPAVANHDVTAIRNSLRPLLGSFELEICDPACVGTTQPGAAALDYFIAGDGNYNPAHLRLYLW